MVVPDNPVHRYRYFIFVLSLVAMASELSLAVTSKVLYFYTGPLATAIFVYFLFKKKYSNGAMAWKMVYDISVVMVNLVWGSQGPHIATVGVYVTFAVYYGVNLFFVRSQWFHFVALGFLQVPIVYSFIRFNDKWQDDFLYTVISPLSGGIFHLLYKNKISEDKARQHRHEEMEKRYSELNDFYRISKLSENLLIHDCKNILQGVILVEMEHAKGQCSDKVLHSAQSIRSGILEKLQLLSDLSRNEFSLVKETREILGKLLPEKSFYSIRIPEEVVVYFNVRLYDSLIYNFCRNSVEAYQERHGRLAGFKFEVSLADQKLHLLDNSGGFDTKKISEGFTTKKNGSGQFLYNILKNQEILGIGIQMIAGEDGTRVEIKLGDNFFQRPGNKESIHE